MLKTSPPHIAKIGGKLGKVQKVKVPFNTKCRIVVTHSALFIEAEILWSQNPQHPLDCDHINFMNNPIKMCFNVGV